MADYHLAQINNALILAPIDDPLIADFKNALAEINALAERSPGFIWRLIGDGDDATSIRMSDDPNLLVNMSVWENIELLYDYAYNSHHVDFFRRRREWFKKWSRPSPVLWWIPAGHTPTTTEALERIEHIEKHGATAYAFNFKQRFTIEDMLNYMAENVTGD